MAGKSQTQLQLDQLDKALAQLIGRVDRFEADLREGKGALSDLRREMEIVRTNVALLSRDLDEVRRNVEELKRTRETVGQRWWTLLPPIVGALASVALSALITYLMNRK